MGGKGPEDWNGSTAWQRIPLPSNLAAAGALPAPRSVGSVLQQICTLSNPTRVGYLRIKVVDRTRPPTEVPRVPLGLASMQGAYGVGVYVPPSMPQSAGPTTQLLFRISPGGQAPPYWRWHSMLEGDDQSGILFAEQVQIFHLSTDSVSSASVPASVPDVDLWATLTPTKPGGLTHGEFLFSWSEFLQANALGLVRSARPGSARWVQFWGNSPEDANWDFQFLDMDQTGILWNGRAFNGHDMPFTAFVPPRVTELRATHLGLAVQDFFATVTWFSSKP